MTATAPEHTNTVSDPDSRTASRRPGTATALRWEINKLAAGARARYILLGCLLAPIAIVAVFHGQQQPPSDTIFGRQVNLSGYAMPLFVLAFTAQWVLPLLAALVAGDIFASEDHHGTWKTILTRSVSRTQVFWAKTFTAVLFNLTALIVLAASTIIASVLIIGTQPLTGLTGQLIHGGSALHVVIASWATASAPIIGFTALAILLSVTTRNPAAGVAAPVVLGLIMQMLDNIGGFDLPRRFLLTTGFEAWHGLVTQHPFHGPLYTGFAVATGWTAICLTAAYLHLRRRDITGG